MGWMKTVLVLLCIFSTQLKADDHELFVHDVAHFGVSSALTTFGYGITRKALHLNRVDSFLFASIAVVAVGMTYKYLEGPGGMNSFGRSMIGNWAGIGFSGLTVWMFDF